MSVIIIISYKYGKALPINSEYEANIRQIIGLWHWRVLEKAKWRLKYGKVLFCESWVHMQTNHIGAATTVIPSAVEESKK